MNNVQPNASGHKLPDEVEVIEYIEESPDLFTLRLKFTDPQRQAEYTFVPGQFNMLYLYGVGEVPISIVSDPEHDDTFDHTIRSVGRVTRGLAQLKAGDRLGLRGPFGHGWPILQSRQRDIVIVTGGLGCAPVVSMINYIEQRRNDFARLNILQGVKHTRDLLWRSRYDHWRKMDDTKVLLCADAGEAIWPWHIGLVSEVFDQLEYDPANTTVMMCGPEGMMHVVCDHMLEQQIPENQLFVSMERNMQCATGHCGHCQFGHQFICKDGPVLSYDRIKPLFRHRGF